MSAKLDAALDAVRRGFAVFPIAPGSKVPLLKENWLQIATTDEHQIRQWWTAHPDANIGGLTGDKLVFDIDKRNGGLDTWSMLKLVDDFPDTAYSVTAGGGAHMMYQLPEGESVKGGTHKAGKGVDIKGHGGYILLPGSTIDERPYTWCNKRPLAFAPQWAIDRFKGSTKPKSESAGKRLVEEDDTARTTFEQWIESHAPRPAFGEIDDTTYKVAARGYDYGCSQETVHELVAKWNDTHCGSLGDTERLAVVVESAGRNRDNAIGSRHPGAPGFEAVEIDESRAPNLEPTKELANKSKFFILRADEAARIALERRGKPLIRGIIDRGTMSVLVGKGGGGKTFLALDWSYHIAKGQDWAGKRVKQGAVVYLAAEAGNMILSRLKALDTHHGALGDAPLYVIPCPANFSRGPEDVKAILALIRNVETQCGQKVELFVVDTLARVMTGDENSAKDMGVILEAVDFIRGQVGCHAMLIHHPNKAGTSARGSGNVFGGTDTEMWVEDKVLNFTKQRDMPLGPDIKFKLATINLGADSDGATITSCVVHVSKAGEGEPRGELTARLRDVWDVLDAALADEKRNAFDMAFLRKLSFRHSSDNGPSRVTLIGWMSELSENGWIKKHTRGQWVRANVGNVGMLSG